MSLTWQGGTAMFSSADGFDFVNMTAGPVLGGSDSQDVVFWDARAGTSGAYVYYGRSHLPGGQTESCRAVTGATVQEPGRSINHFVIGEDLSKWPYNSADENSSELVVLNADVDDPPCLDIYTNVATPLGDATFLFPMVYNHWDTAYLLRLQTCILPCNLFPQFCTEMSDIYHTIRLCEYNMHGLTYVYVAVLVGATGTLKGALSMACLRRGWLSVATTTAPSRTCPEQHSTHVARGATE